MDNVIKKSIEIAHGGNVYLKYGVAGNHDGRTSGIVWADCVIQNHGKRQTSLTFILSWLHDFEYAN